MSMYPQSSEDENDQNRHGQTPLGNQYGYTQRRTHDVQHQLQQALRHGLAVENMLWSTKMTDWVVALHAADIDGDGETEILVGSRNGRIRAYTRFGALKWERRFKGCYISAIAAIALKVDGPKQQVCIVVGLRSGKVIALDKNGMQINGWEYDVERTIRQIAISEHSLENIVVGSEDRFVYVLDSVTGKLRWRYLTSGWVRCVFVCDIDDDGQDEILVGSGDRNLYIFDIRGQLLYTFDTGYRVYALYAAQLEPAGPMCVVMSSNRKDLMAWQVTRSSETRWVHSLAWLRSPEDEKPLLANRVHSIYVRDIDNDGEPEILAGSEDGHLIVLDSQGHLRWKQDFQSCIYQVYAKDINYDGLVEVLVGTEDDSAYVFQLELDKHLDSRIKELYDNAAEVFNWKQITEHLTTRESTLLKDFIDQPLARPQRMELEEAKCLMQEQQYEQALGIILRLIQQKVQYCWSQPLTVQGYVWSGCFSNLSGGKDDELVIGTEQGYIYALDLSQEQGKHIWSSSFGETSPSRVRMICPGPVVQGEKHSIMAVLADNRIILLDQQGQVLRNQALEEGEQWIAHFHAVDEPSTGEVILGLEDRRIVFWNGLLDTRIGQFKTEQGIGAAYAYDLLRNGTDQIITGTLKNGVYTYTRDGEILWSFETEDRVEALYVADIDKDGWAEVIVGSEDRNVYVLDYEGHLKWRYQTQRGAMDIDVCDVKMEGDADDPRERPLKILVSSKDNYLYMFNASGDLIWQYQCLNRARMVRARDVNKDGRYEIALASEDQLELFQILLYDELKSLRDECWSKLSANYTDRESIRRFAEHLDDYIRGSALTVLAGIHTHDEEDFRYLQKALKEDESIEVRRALVHAAANLCQIPGRVEQNIRWARQLLEGLYHTPEEAIRLEIVSYLPLLEEGLFFEYLERSADSANAWVRRAVVRRLDKLVERYPELVFRLLLKTARDKEEWVRQESGRALAHYFDVHIAHFVSDLFALLDQNTNLIVLQQIVYSVKHPALKGLFQNLLKQLTEAHAENLSGILNGAIYNISMLNKLGVFYGEELLQMYEELYQIFRVKTISAIAGYQRITRSDILLDTPLAHIGQSIPALDAFEEVARVVATYERRQTVGERVSSLIEARSILEKVRSDLHHSFASSDHQAGSHSPEKFVLVLLIDQWSTLISNELVRMRGAALLVPSLGNTTVPRLEEVVVSLRIRNDGQCSADHVRIELEVNPDFDIVGSRRYEIVEISTKMPVNIDFNLRLYKTPTRLVFHLTFDDGERKHKTQEFADEIIISDYQRAYHHIENPYTTGAPIREKNMFYGRKEDLRFLHENLGSRAANRVVLLWGQRRMGKTSLIYQLANELATDYYIPVFIDLQDLSLKESSAQLLEGFAQSIFKEVLHYKEICIAEPVHEYFLADASSAFREYLASVWKWLPNHRLILLFDEFDAISQHIERNGGEHILYYLRSLMQHYPGLNFLLSGAPQMPFTEGYHSVFFNIAKSRKLSKLQMDEARELITVPVCNDLEYDVLALEKMLTLTDGWPYYIHVMSEKLIAHCNAVEKPYVTISEINAALELVLSEQASSFRWIWQDLTSPIEKLVLSLLAQEKGEEGRVFSLNDIQKEFDVYGVQYVHESVIEALGKLTRGDLIEEAFDGVQYQIPVGLIKAWLRKEKPPERVVREEKFFEDDPVL